MSRPQRCLPAAITLFFLAPLVAEFLLGDLPITLLPALIMLAPMYGGGALLIRELTRRSGRGWPTLLLLGCAYGLIEEGFSTQSLFNPNYLHMHLLAHAWIPALGIGAWWTLLMFNVHPLCSMGISIALAEGLVPARARSPWLGKPGLAVAALLFVAGVAAGAVYGWHQDHFRASNLQFLATALACAVFTLAAFLLPARPPRAIAGTAPSPWIAALMAFLLGMVVFFTPPQAGWLAFAVLLAADALFLTALWFASHRPGWTPLHTLSLAAGGALFYGLHAFVQYPVVPGRHWIARLGNLIFLALAIATVALATRRTRAALRATETLNMHMPQPL